MNGEGTVTVIADVKSSIDILRSFRMIQPKELELLMKR
jgi:hypothetical protein